MKKLLLPCLLFGFVLSGFAAQTAVTTTKKSAIAIGNGSFALVKGTPLEVIAREGDMLIVKYRSSQGKIPLVDTDYSPENAEPASGQTSGTQPAATTPSGAAAPTKPASAGAKPVAVKPATPATAPALNPGTTGQQPATNYGKAVQKAKQASEAHKSTHVDPTKGIMDDEVKK